MTNVLQFKRRDASKEVIDNLVRLGYLKQTTRHNADAIEDALVRLQNDLCRSQVISEGDLLGCYQTAPIAKIRYIKN
jgi:hypothetical protein